MSEQELMRCMIDCYRRYYMDKLADYASEKDPLRRDYLIRAMQMMVSNSFLRQHVTGLGEMPEAVKKLLKAK